MTDIRGPLSMVGSAEANRVPSVSETLFREYARGKISKDEYETGTAIEAARSIHEYIFRPYPTLQPIVAEYIRARINHVREQRDSSMYRRVGHWAHEVRQRFEQNEADHATLVWCLERLQKHKLGNYVQAVEKALLEFHHPLPKQLEDATLCVTMDSREKSREESGR